MPRSHVKTHIWHNLPVAKAAKILATDVNQGLTEEKVVELQKHGRNVLPEEKRLSKQKIFLSQFKSPLVYILLGAGIITLVLREFADAIVIFTAVLVNTTVGYFQEFKASDTLREFKKVLKVKAIVFRNGQEKEVPQEDLVPGDLIILKQGNKVPADCRICQAWNLKIQEAVLTGEWLAAEKVANTLPKDTVLAERENMAYMGTVAEEGEGKAIVIAIGRHTEVGKVAGLVKKAKEDRTPYQKKLSHFSKIVGAIIAVACLLIFIEGVVTKRDGVEMFLTSVAVAVAAIPEGLPVAMTVILALGMQRILKRKGLVRKLASAETLGSTSIIATDKTLTLTQGRMQVSEIKAEDKKFALEIAALANEAFVENPQDNFSNWKIRGGPMDKALLEAAGEAGILRTELEKHYLKVEEVPFNVQDKFVASFYRKKGGLVCYLKGAPERVIALSAKTKSQQGQKRITKATLSHLEKELEELTGKGLRVVAVAYKKIKNQRAKIKIENQNAKLFRKEIKELVFVGFIGLKDPLRKEAKEAFQICQKAGLRPILVTGDHLLTAKAVAEELGLKTLKENIMLGSELDKLPDDALAKKLNHINVFARVEPKHKLRIIEAWQRKNQIVAMTGDGINDAPALKKADIGVALGSGTDVAKDVSDLVLLNDNFSILVAAVEEGRAILDNIRKVITYLLSDSFTEVILVGASIVAGMPLPLTAAQILWVNLIEDGLPSIALAFEPKEKDLMERKPDSLEMPLLTAPMKTIIFFFGLFTDLILLGLFFWFYSKFGRGQIDYIRTIIFVGLTIDSLSYVFSCKSLRKNIWRTNIFSNKLLVAGWVFGVLLLLVAIYVPTFQVLLKTVPLGIYEWLLLLGFGLVHLLLIETIKYYFMVKEKVKNH